MNKIERVQAALWGEPVDRVPASFWFHFPSDQIASHAMAQAHLKYYRTADPDILKVMNDNGYALVGADEIRGPADWRKLKPAPLASKPYQNQLDGLREIVDSVGDEVLIVTTIFNPYATGNSVSGRKVTEHLKADPESVAVGLSTIAQSLAEFSQACIEAGAAGIYFSAQGGETDRFTPEEFEKYIKPNDLAVLRAAEEAGATLNVLHICGHWLRLAAYADYPAHAVNWAPQHGNLSLSEGRELFQRTIIGGVDERGPIVDGRREEIVAEVQAAIAEMGKRGFMIGAGCTVPNDIRVEHLVWARQAVLE
jgi:uroporphyrinogen decarboxylase